MSDILSQAISIAPDFLSLTQQSSMKLMETSIVELDYDNEYDDSRTKSPVRSSIIYFVK